MMLLYYLLFFAVSYLATLIIFGYSTYHRYFWWAGPLLATFAVGQAYLLCQFGLAPVFVWHLVLMVFVFVWWGFKTKKQIDIMAKLPPNTPDDYSLMMKSSGNTMLFFFFSVFVYMAAFVIGFVYIYNTYFLGSGDSILISILVK